VVSAHTVGPETAAASVVQPVEGKFERFWDQALNCVETGQRTDQVAKIAWQCNVEPIVFLAYYRKCKSTALVFDGGKSLVADPENRVFSSAVHFHVNQYLR